MELSLSPQHLINGSSGSAVCLEPTAAACQAWETWRGARPRGTICSHRQEWAHFLLGFGGRF